MAWAIQILSSGFMYDTFTSSEDVVEYLIGDDEKMKGITSAGRLLYLTAAVPFVVWNSLDFGDIGDDGQMLDGSLKKKFMTRLYGEDEKSSMKAIMVMATDLMKKTPFETIRSRFPSGSSVATSDPSPL